MQMLHLHTWMLRVGRVETRIYIAGLKTTAVNAISEYVLLVSAGSAKGGWEAAFGPLKPQQRALEQRKQAPDAGEGLPKVEDLWDAPSHALPAPSMLVGASLEALLGSAA